MKITLMSFIRKVLNDERGQALPWIVLAMAGMLGASGFTIDAGHAYVVHSQLQNSANASALAAAGNVYNSSSTTNATTIAGTYAGSSGDLNKGDTLVTVKTTISTKCLNLLMPAGTSCTTGTPSNSVQVTESASVPTFFMNILGISTIPVVAQATASMQGMAQPWNVAIIEDATGSMATADTNCGGISEFKCALNGIQALLAATNPNCPSGASNCPTGVNFRVALFTFPNIITSDLPVANACSGTTYTTPAPYQVMTLPLETATSYTPLSYTQGTGSSQTTWSASYEVTYGASDADTNGFVSDYYSPTSTTTGGLNSKSSIVQAVGYGGSGGKTGCLPVSPAGIDINGATNVGASQPSISPASPNAGTVSTSSTVVNTMGVGEGITYYAAAIYAAQAALTAEATANPGSKNAIILLSDGQANTQWIYFPQGSMKPGAVNTALASKLASTSTGYDTLKTTPLLTAKVASALTTPNQETTGTISGVYPDFIDECQQAIVAAQKATLAGTRVYAVAYGAEQSGCGSGSKADDYTDVTKVTLPSTANDAFSTAASLTPCITMENIASSLDYFYSDYLQSGSSVATNCVDNSHTVTSLSQIFASIAATFTNPRLLPNNAQ